MARMNHVLIQLLAIHQGRSFMQSQRSTLVLLVFCIGFSICGSIGVASQEEQDQPLPPTEAAASMQVPEGFEVSLFAGEPDVQQPIGFCIDDRGRLWVAEAYNYPNHTTEPGDRILIFEDTDGDGRFDERTVFYDQLNYVTGIEVGFGGAWVMSPPYFYFIPDRDGDDQPDGPPQVLLDGFGTHANAHNLANGFAWGPDGWLYGTHGRTNWSMIGKPGASDEERVRFDGGVYRYHPVTHEWEPFADGTTNPWGIDWDDYGEAFICNCVNPHLFHAIQGAHFEPWRNRKSSEFAYQRIDTIADHLHFVGGGNIRDGIGSDEEDAAGGGHAHCGTMVYLGDNWPDHYRNTIFMNNIHGRRINNDILEQHGSGYRASHGSDIMRSQDPWFMGVTLTYGFDGCVYVSDWSDTGECHSTRNTRRGTGRIYRIAYGDPNSAAVDISSLSNEQLVKLQLHRNDRFVKHARRVLQERFAANVEMTEVHDGLMEIYLQNDDVTRRLRALWSLHATGGAELDFLENQLRDESEYIRSWAIRLLCESKQPSDSALNRIAELAKTDPSPRVRLHIASALQRFALEDRWSIAEALVTHSEDRTDPNLPLMIWYGIEPLVDSDLRRYIKLALRSKLPTVRRFVARRVAESDHRDQGLAIIAEALVTPAAIGSNDLQGDLLDGLLVGLQGQRQLPTPREWSEVFPILRDHDDESISSKAIRLAIRFRDDEALQAVLEVARDNSLDSGTRTTAIDAVVGIRAEGFDELLLDLLDDEDVRLAAVRGLANYNHPSTAARILLRYKSMDDKVRQQALQTLASRRTWASALLDAIEVGTVDASDLTAFTARQIRSLDDETLSERLEASWGNVRPTSDDRKRQIDRLKRQLSPANLEHADLANGRSLFAKHCATCHRFFDQGEEVGPNITGSQRTNLEYMLENLVDPSASVSKDYQMEVIETISGRVINALVINENDRVLTVQSANERLVIPVDDIESRTESPLSIMPEGLLEPLTQREVRDLFGYLGSPQQVPLANDEED